VDVRETVDAGKAKLGRAAALKLARDASKVVVAKGKKVETYDMKRDPPDEARLLKAMLGPTGNLRAPALRRGKTLLVGFHDDAYADALTSGG